MYAHDMLLLSDFLIWSKAAFWMTAPIGPICILLIEYTLNYGLKKGLLVSIFSGFSNAFFGIVIFFSLTNTSSFINKYSLLINGMGGLMLASLAVFALKALISNKNANSSDNVELSSSGLFVKIFLLNIFNTVFILGFVYIIQTTDITITDWSGLTTLIGGVFLGTMAFWILLLAVLMLLRSFVTKIWLYRIQIISNIILLLLGIILMIPSLKPLFIS